MGTRARLHSNDCLDVLGWLQWSLFGATERIVDGIVSSIFVARNHEASINSDLLDNLQQFSNLGRPESEDNSESRRDFRSVHQEFVVVDELQRHLKSNGRSGHLPLAPKCANRILGLLELLLWLIILVVFIPIALISVFLRASLHYFRDELVLSPVPRHYRLEPRILSRLTIKTWNVALSEMGTMNTINLLPSSRSRVMGVLAESVRDNPDVICWQEAFHPFLMAHVAVPFLHQRGYSVLYGSRNRDAISMNSGLLIASRFDIIDFDFRAYERPTRLNRFANKGILAARIRLSGPDAKDIVVSTTHGLCAEYYPDGVDRNSYLLGVYMRHQAAARAFIEEFAARMQPAVCDAIATGDFNAGRFDGELGSPDVTVAYDATVLEQFTRMQRWGYAFKDLTVPDRMVPTAVTAEREGLFMRGLADNETGSARGTSMHRNAFTFRYSLDILVMMVEKSPFMFPTDGRLHKNLRKLLGQWEGIKDHIAVLRQFGLSPNEATSFIELVNRCLEEYKEKLYLSPQVLDHILLQKRAGSILRDTEYDYTRHIPLYGGRILSDHCPISVVLRVDPPLLAPARVHAIANPSAVYEV